MNKYLAVAHWDDNGYITGSNHAETMERADELKTIMVDEGNAEAFYVLYPETGSIFTWVVDGVAKTVTDGVKNPVIVQEEWVAVRAERNRLLVDSDYSQLDDAPDSDKKTIWAEYRQLLRDLPASTENPDEVTWPEAPE